MSFRPKRNHSPGPVVDLHPPVALSEEDRRAIFAVCDGAVYAAGRTSVMMALRGSRAQKIQRLGLVDNEGHGHFAGMSEDDVLARIDTLIHEGLLRIERTREGLPLLGYTAAGLEVAKGYTADLWLEEVRGQVGPVAAGRALKLSFLMTNGQQRNNDTVLLLVDRVEREADATWLPMLRAWCAAETKRLRGRLRPVIERLEGDGALQRRLVGLKNNHDRHDVGLEGVGP
ncbi:MAG: RQC domain-containing protein [Verrucomicrobiota bacterium]